MKETNTEYLEFLKSKQKSLIHSGFDVNESYYELAKANLKALVDQKNQVTLF